LKLKPREELPMTIFAEIQRLINNQRAKGKTRRNDT